MPRELTQGCTVTSIFGDGVLQLKSMRVSEGISSLSSTSLQLVSTEVALNARNIVGTALTVSMSGPEGGSRKFHGYVTRFTQLGPHRSDEERVLIAYEAVTVPWFWLLTQNHDCRVYEQKSVIEIVEDVFSRHSYAEFEWFNLSRDYAGEKMDYCVQYRESDYAFVCRMFEQWGLSYTFRHEAGRHVLVIFDESAALPDNEGNPQVTYAGASGTAAGGDVEDWIDGQDYGSGKFMLKDYNFEDPTNDLEMPINSRLSLGPNANHELFDDPGEFVTEQEGKTGSRGEMFVQFRMEAKEATARRIEGSSICTGFWPGTHFTMNGHFNDEYNGGKFLLTKVDHDVIQAVGAEDEPTVYRNTFTCIPSTLPFRTRQVTGKPMVTATQTAVVVGPEGEEIHCDQYARIRIRFHWDRHSATDGSDVCWARVQQSLAGQTWGTQFLPRIGQEVVVTFIDGDPDRPLVTGAVYNATHMPPYELPANKTQSGWKTRSTTEGGAGNFNEIRFEDKKGSEEIFIQGEKDYNTEIKNNESRWVGVDQELTVDGNRTVHVKGDVDETIDGNETRTVSGSVEETVTGGMKITTPGAFEVTATGGVKFTAPAGVQVVAPGGQTQVDQFWEWQGFKHATYGNLSISVMAISIGTTGVSFGTTGAKQEHTGYAMGTTGIKLEQTGVEIGTDTTSIKQKALALVTCGFYSVQ